LADFEYTNPTVGHSTNTWGDQLNVILDILKAHPGIKVVADATAKEAYTPLIGQVVYQQSNNTLYKYTGVTWEEIGGGGSAVSSIWGGM
jgi:hypothetical protein